MAVEFKEEDTIIKIDETFENITLPPFTKCVFHNCKFRHVTFEYDLHNIQFINCEMHWCSFYLNKIYNCIFIDNCFKNTLFTSNHFYNTIFYNCTVSCFSAFFDTEFNKSKFMKTGFYTAALGIYICDKNDKLFDKDCGFSKTNFISDILDTSSVTSVTSSYGKETILRENIIGYKKCRNGNIVTLEIPTGAVVFSHNGNKCRTNKAKVLKIETLLGEEAERAYSINNGMSYYVGDEITVHNFDLRYNLECSTGIHFFMTKQEAQSYLYI